MSDTRDALIAEIRELRRELQSSEDRLLALARSRWWRLHPRRLLGGAARLDDGAPIPAPSRDVAAQRPTADVPVPGDSRLATFHAEVVARGSFTQDWVTARVPEWEPVLQELEGRESRILEIGSYEGLSTCFLLWRLPSALVTCVDPFIGTPEDVGGPPIDLEATFDANVALVDAARVRKLVGLSRRRLVDLVDDGERFELVYVDGSHLGLDVLVDAALAWDLLTESGVMVFDDYRWEYLGSDPLLRPGPAIDAFREVVSGRHEVLFADGQIALRRTR